MSAWSLLFLLLAAPSGDRHPASVELLPVCGNRVINAVVRRAGCTVGDDRCWKRGGGMCADYVEGRIRKERSAKAIELTSVGAEEVVRGDVAVFTARAHLAYVEAVRRDPKGRLVAVDVAEFNFGTCWVDREAMITDTYGVLTRRRGVAAAEVDGGFRRAVSR